MANDKITKPNTKSASTKSANTTDIPLVSTTTKKSRSTKAKKSDDSATSNWRTKCTSFGFQPVIVTLLSITMVAALAGFGLSIYNFLHANSTTISYVDNDGNAANFTEGSIAETAAKVTPGVVSIVTEIQTTGFFGQSSTSSAAGTGMIVTEDGYVLTNKHVISDATSVSIVLDDGTTYDKVKLIGVDPLNDVAFLKIQDAKDLPTVTLGDSKTISVGQQVIAIGNALGQFQNTITAGVISGTGRSITAASSDYSNAETLTDMIQTDAAINSGNSGGPLVNAAGQVIGINTATSSDADGIGFAIPISSVKGMLKNIITNNSAKRAYLGAYYVIITPDVAKNYDLPVSSGAYLYSPQQYSAVIADGPADKAGLEEKDIILEINGVKVGSAGSISTLLGEYMPGETVQFKILRGKEEKTIDVKLEEYKDKNANSKQ